MDETELINKWMTLNTEDVDPELEADGLTLRAPTHANILYAHFNWWVLEQGEWWRDPPKKNLFKRVLIEWQKNSKYGFDGGAGSRSTPGVNGTSMTPIFNLVINKGMANMEEKKAYPDYARRLKDKATIDELREGLAKANKIADLYKQLYETLK